MELVTPADRLSGPTRHCCPAQKNFIALHGNRCVKIIAILHIPDHNLIGLVGPTVGFSSGYQDLIAIDDGPNKGYIMGF